MTSRRRTLTSPAPEDEDDSARIVSRFVYSAHGASPAAPLVVGARGVQVSSSAASIPIVTTPPASALVRATHQAVQKSRSRIQSAASTCAFTPRVSQSTLAHSKDDPALMASTSLSPPSTHSNYPTPPPLLRAESKLRVEQATFTAHTVDPIRARFARESRNINRDWQDIRAKQVAFHGTDALYQSLERIAWSKLLEEAVIDVPDGLQSSPLSSSSGLARTQIHSLGNDVLVQHANLGVPGVDHPGTGWSRVFSGWTTAYTQ